MNLKSFLDSGSKSQDDLASILGVSQGMISHWVTGRNRLTAERAIQIEQATDGQVSRYALRPDIFGQPNESQQ